MKGFIILMTAGFANLNPDVQAEMMRIALSKINPKTDWLVFDPEADGEQLEDEGRTLRVPFGKNLGKGVCHPRRPWKRRSFKRATQSKRCKVYADVPTSE